jgi:4-aminobutyrate aminotransferase-like enzyme
MALPRQLTAVPGPRSKALATELRQYESPGITYVDDRFPVFWESASGCLVRDVDGNEFLDLCSAFGVASIGHCHPAVASALERQARTLIHGMGDVHPSRLKVELETRLAGIAPGDLQQCILGTSGSDAVEAALKTAVMATGKPGVLAFHGGYHGLSYGALDATSRDLFRAPFQAQLGGFTSHVSYPGAPVPGGHPATADESLDAVDAAFRAAGSRLPIGAVIVEPIQGRGGIIVPPPGWLARVQEICRSYSALLIADEVFTGLGRTGAWFASEVVPDLLCIGKTLGGGVPISACIGSAATMGAWGASQGEAVHTSTFLGSPLGCAAALAVLETLEQEGLIARCQSIGTRLRAGLEQLMARNSVVVEVRGRGLMLGIELREPDGKPATAIAIETIAQALQRSLILLPAGPAGNVIEILPPFVIGDDQIDFALAALDESIQAAAGR